MSSVEAVRSLLSLDSVVKGVKEGDFQTDLAVDRWVRWLSVGLTLLLSTILIVKDFYSGDRVFCLPTDNLQKYTTSYAWAFSGNVNGYCGTNMTHVEKYRYEPANWSVVDIDERKVIVEEEWQLFQHIFPLVLVIQAMHCSLPFFMWSLSAVGDIEANLKFMKRDLEKHFKENIEPFMNVREDQRTPRRDDSTVLKELKTACSRWIGSRQQLTVKYFICLKFMTIFLGLIFFLFYLFCPYGMWNHVSKLEFTCNIQNKMIFNCMLSTGHFVPIVWIVNIIALSSCILLGILHTATLLIRYKGKPLLRKLVKEDNFFEAVAGIDAPETDTLKKHCLVYNDYEFMSDVAYRNIRLMDCYYYMLATVLKTTLKRKAPKADDIEEGLEKPRQRVKEHIDGDGDGIKLDSIAAGENNAV